MTIRWRRWRWQCRKETTRTPSVMRPLVSSLMCYSCVISRSRVYVSVRVSYTTSKERWGGERERKREKERERDETSMLSFAGVTSQNMKRRAPVILRKCARTISSSFLPLFETILFAEGVRIFRIHTYSHKSSDYEYSWPVYSLRRYVGAVLDTAWHFDVTNDSPRACAFDITTLRIKVLPIEAVGVLFIPCVRESAGSGRE